jgi:hypothetical protein
MAATACSSSRVRKFDLFEDLHFGVLGLRSIKSIFVSLP